MATSDSIGSYKKIKRLGRGSIGTVFLVEDSKGKQRAIKVLNVENEADNRTIRKLKREAKINKKLYHPSVVHVEKYVDNDPEHYLVMEYAPGEDLAKILGRRGQLPFEDVIQISWEVCKALEYAHSRGVVHRDIKPRNVIVDKGNKIQVADFGLASITSQSIASLTSALGTPNYTSPEQAKGERGDQRSDIYSLGAMMYEMLAGNVPFEAGNPTAILLKHLNENPKPIAEQRTDISDRLARLVHKAMEKSPNDRFQTATSMRAAIEMVAEAQNIPLIDRTPPPTFWEKVISYKDDVLVGVSTNAIWAGIVFLFLLASGLIGSLQNWDVDTIIAWLSTTSTPTPTTSTPTFTPTSIIELSDPLTDTPSPTFTRTPSAATDTPRPPTPTQTPTYTRSPTNTPRPPTATRTPANSPTAISAPAIGDTWIRPADGKVMVYVPAGEFTMGSLPGEGEGDEMPQHTVFLDAFWIDRTETGGERPTVRLSWNEAQDYCNSVGGRLPTEAEWEKAARGTDGREYPWGNDIPDNTKANYCEEGEDCGIEKRPDGLLVYKEQGPVGLFPAGASPYGALDMAGNVWEWVADWYDPSYYTSSPSENPSGPDNGDNKVLKGGSFNNSAWEIRSANRHSALPKDGDKSIGFRCMVIP